jgi:Fusaric acid resistance protein-like
VTHLRIGLAALVTTAAAAGACGTAWLLSSLLGAGGSSAVLATVVALSLGRREFAGRAEFTRSAVLLPVIGLAAAGVGWLLTALPVIGAVVFVAGMSVPVWLRRFGPRAARLGALISLPLTAMLVVPVAPPVHVPVWASALLALVSGVVAVLWVALAREVLALLGPVSRGRGARATTVSPGAASTGAAPTTQAATPPRETTRPAPPAPPSPAPPAPAPPAPASKNRSRLPASTRMALQLAVALSAAFIVGWLVFPAHAIWVVLTAYIVNAGNRGRGDVLHKSVLRVVGALGGSIAAVGMALAVPTAGGFAAVAVIFVALFVGTWLRTYSYAYWALTVTLVLTLLQELFGVSPLLGPGGLAGEAGMLAERIAAIVVGAALGVAPAWFVLPVRSTDVLRRRLSELLVALTATLTASEEDRATRLAAFHTALARVE